jgi:hypothetical protein
LTDCTSRNPLDEPTESTGACGEGCAKDIDNVCKQKCDNDFHYKANELGECILAKCEERKVNASVSPWCGDDCYAAEESVEGGDCINECKDIKFYFFFFFFVSYFLFIYFFFFFIYLFFFFFFFLVIFYFFFFLF